MTGATTGNSSSSGINKVGTKTFNAGITTVTYTARDASGNSETCSFNVTVTDEQPPTVSCPADRTLCQVPDDTYTIPLLITSDNCGIATISYSIAGATTRNDSGNNASGVFALGLSAITWTVTDVNGQAASCTTNVTIVPNVNCSYVRAGEPVGNPTAPKVKDIKQDVKTDSKLEVLAYPNPTESWFNLKVKSSRKETVEIRVFDMLGKLVQEDRGAPEQVYRLGDHIVSGMYLVEVRQAGQIVTVKVVKQ
jgi:hypothetical protein